MPTDAEFWDRSAARYARRPVADEIAYRRTLERVRSYLRPDHRALELGCGTASTALALAPHLREILATDLSGAMIEIGRQKAAAAGATNLRLSVAHPDSAPPGPFDVVLAFNLFHLLSEGELETSLAAIHARLDPGGLFVSKTPCLGDTRSGFLRGAMRAAIAVMQRLGRAPGQVRFLTVRDWQEQVRLAGFDLIETGNYPEDPPNHFIVARRR